MATQVLLTEDVETLGRQGEVVSVREGYARNFLLPQKVAVVASERTLRMQQKLKEERLKKAIQDKQESEETASRLQGITLTVVVKVDHDGHMYGSVSAADIVHLLQEHHHVSLERKAIQLKHPVKTTGVHDIHVKLKEDVTALVHLKIISEEGHRLAQQEQK
jgi:large subunit ribosomal protein L9